MGVNRTITRSLTKYDLQLIHDALYEYLYRSIATGVDEETCKQIEGILEVIEELTEK